jgi:hypothetical protein
MLIWLNLIILPDGICDRQTDGSKTNRRMHTRFNIEPGCFFMKMNISKEINLKCRVYCSKPSILVA